MSPNAKIVLSHETIKPSSPTPYHSQTLKLSLIDQNAPSIYIPLIFFYKHHNENPIRRDEKSRLFKQSLSKVLTKFYPLAGRINNESSTIECTDAGVVYIEAEVKVNLSNVLENPEAEKLKEFLPQQSYGGADDDHLLAIQISFLDCGAIAVGVCLSHKVGDGSSIAKFMNAWATTCREDGEYPKPIFGFSSHFVPAVDLFATTSGPINKVITNEKLVTKKFIFDKEILAVLKNLGGGFGQVIEVPTRVEAVSGFIWRIFIEINKNKHDKHNNKSLVAVHAVNLRPRVTPPLSDHAFGNLWTLAMAFFNSDENDDGDDHHQMNPGFQNLVEKFRTSFTQVNADFAKETGYSKAWLDRLAKWSDTADKENVELCAFSSWSRFPLYEVDFGWGKPVWTCTTTLPFKNAIILMSTSDEQGIEAWVNMVEEDMAVLESHINLLF